LAYHVHEKAIMTTVPLAMLTIEQRQERHLCDCSRACRAVPTAFSTNKLPSRTMYLHWLHGICVSSSLYEPALDLIDFNVISCWQELFCFSSFVHPILVYPKWSFSSSVGLSFLCHRIGLLLALLLDI
jgi:hypothetical protein